MRRDSEYPSGRERRGSLMNLRTSQIIVSVLVSALLGMVVAGDSKGRKDAKGEAKLPTITNSIGQPLVLIPAGEFLMGSKESPDQLDRLFPGYKIKRKPDLFE